MSNAREGSALFSLRARVEGEKAAASLASILEKGAEAVSSFEIAARGRNLWQIEAYAKAPRLTSLFEVSLTLAAAANGGRLLALGEKRLERRDWLAENRLAFPPQRVGRFFIYGSHWQGPKRAGAIPVLIDAATAFGSGEHPSTRGCLLLMGFLAGRLQRRPRRVLDVGTGSGILAVAAAKLWRSPVVASDIDKEAAAAAGRNSRRNGVGLYMRARAAAGYRDPLLRRARYDLVLSNIFSRPLALLARDLGAVLEGGGRAILSGFVPRQEAIVLAAHRYCGMFLERRLVIDGWSCLLLRKGGAPPKENAGRSRSCR